eukprot:CAMPEP_0203913236 /NCGR_PEP_ID=MMETSP0359-20131031/54257_1 /ASSEMBLY_ACC=CAM_ASM_000338 /TAXON_ID=268821 /ORGANISM="Scrippsiella Hangoei, Strain SHTV-5" /LENGTH=920 /DNA_ID=CAMNT_0050839337 /DNA_START=356 /DNA_END=3118 /DNA_ORIENTATION=-
MLTVYALFGDDFRLSATHKTMDNFFNVMTLLCLMVFTLEVVVSSLGKEGYFLGFFFLLDCGATVTLFFDLTWVWNEFACNNAGDGGSGALKTSRAGRAGARAARTVRIIRLIRLVKLYKTYKGNIEHNKGRRPSKDSGEAHPGGGEEPEEEEEDDLISEGYQDDLQVDNLGGEAHPKKAAVVSETRVGKKLSEMTTRRVIVLVLVMLFVMPLFQTSFHGFEDLRTSADMGVELVYDRLRDWCLARDPSDPLPWCLQALETPADALSEQRRADRAWFEEYLLNYIYSHVHGNFAWHLFWVGLKSTTLAASLDDVGLADYIARLGQLNQPRFLGPLARSSDRLTEWDSLHANPLWTIPGVSVEESVRQRLTKPWTERCHHYFGVGVSVTDAKDYEETPLCSYDEELRCSELQSFFPLAKSEWEEHQLSLIFVFDIRATTQLAAGLSILQTIFICLAVGIGSMLFTHDANQLLLNPIERMMAKMEAIKDNPLYAMKLGDIEFRREEIKQAKLQDQLARMNRCVRWLYTTYNANKAKEPMETMILEKTIIKLGGLLALGFGEAGAEIIGQNMRGGHSAGVNAMVAGRKVDVIIAFCSIRNFTDATETLKEEVMQFVNQIGEIVHGCVDDYMGAPNKNIGDCFLLVWRLSGIAPDKQKKLADMAMMSIVRMIAEVNKSRKLAVYREHPGLLQRVRKYRVKLGFGLHCGWAIEGAIGSEFKIDASYLSPNVNVASRLEAATKQFGVLTLISHFMVRLCSPELGVNCRLIDQVTVKGSKQPIRLYTIDLDHMQLKVSPKKTLAMRNRFKLRQLREAQRNEKWSDDYFLAKVFAADADIINMRAAFAPEFFLRFSMAFRNYEAGEWRVARDMFYTCHYCPEKSMEYPTNVEEEDWPVDGPTRTLLTFMRKTHYHPPSQWPGHRELTEK